MNGFTAADVPDQHGRTFVVTGSNTGIGFGAATTLAGKGARVVLACRSEARAREAMAQIGQAVPDAKLAFVPLDQADIASVRRAADMLGDEPRIDGLINNAGVMFPPLERTVQGYEPQFGINHLGTFALTGLLLPKLAETPGSRVVVTASLAHRRGNLDFDDLKAERSYNRGQRYSASKLANMLFFFELDRRLRAAGSPVMAVGCHPGVAMTELMRHLPGPLRLLTPLARPFFNAPEAGAWPALQAATDPAALPGGFYGPTRFKEMRGPSGPAWRTQRSQRTDLSERLWEVSIAATGVDPGLAPAS
ncbi:MAG: SDR family NAD(P)-dependent oxidoreductase [Sphingomonadales bacterium]|nr:SDR family NAD(P)-dependent oxidoreductase [Sphingomonadales bacterium]